MKSFIRIIALILSLLFLALSAACAAKPDGPGSDSGTETEAAPVETGSYEDYVLPKEDGYNQLTLYWSNPKKDYSTCDVWMWWDGADGRGYPFHRCNYGAMCVVNVPESVEQVGFIVRTDCSDPCGTSWGSANKDYADDRFAVITAKETVIYLKTGDSSQYRSSDGGKTLEKIKLFTMAGIISENEIRYYITPATRITSLEQVKITCDGNTVAAESVSSMNNNVITGIIKTKDKLDISKSYNVWIEGYGSVAALPTTIFDSADFIANYTYDGDDLGAVINGDSTTFKVWAPTASRVVLNLFRKGDGEDAYRSVDMEKAEKGVWTYTEKCGHGTYYTYSVTTAAGTQEAVDPYVRAVGVNGNRGMVVDLSLTDPAGFSDEKYYDGTDTYSDAVIWEVHVRDFSNGIADSEYKGKYLAFTETGLKNESGVPVGVDYLKQLGITHVHLQPVYDFATVDESSSEEQFNWGYDPKNYNVPEGSYSTDPYNGEVRINEFKRMVQSLHENGIGVVMDVVYNHTYDGNSNLNRIVPYYYYRYTSTGANSNGSGCGNETASDRVMFRKYMVDSIRYWASEYMVDGFRFDLMALHDIDTMQAIETALHEINPKALIYGEGWTGGTSALRSEQQATQSNISKIVAAEGAAGGISVFNDAIRDGLKGSVFDEKSKGYISGDASVANANKVIFGIKGGVMTPGVGWSVTNSSVVNYTSSHDNHTLWDKLNISAAGDRASLLKMNRAAAAVVFLSKGTPFFLAGEEMLRSKGGDSNSYKSSDEVNNIKWEALTPDSDEYAMSQFYAKLIKLRRENDFIKYADIECKLLAKNAIEVRYSKDGATLGIAVINPNAAATAYSLPEGEWTVLSDSESGLSGTVSGSVTVSPISVVLFGK